MPVPEEFKNRGQELVTTEQSRSTEGDLITKTIVKVPNDTALPSFDFGDERVALETDQINEKTLVVIERVHEGTDACFYDPQFEQGMQRQKRTTTSAAGLDYAATIDGETADIQNNATDTKHTEQVVVRPFNSTWVERAEFYYDDELSLDLVNLRLYINKDGHSLVAVGDPYEFDGVDYTVVAVRYRHYSEEVWSREMLVIPTPEDNILSEKTEYEPIGFQAPAILEIHVSSWDIPSAFTIRPPWLGVNYDLTPHRTVSYAAVVKTIYTLGAHPDPLPTVFNVTTPGAASRVLPIPENTIHPDFFVSETAVVVGTAIVEQFAASTPSPDDYDPLYFLCVQVSDKVYKGNIRVRRLVFISPDSPPADFPIDYEVVNGIVIPI